MSNASPRPFANGLTRWLNGVIVHPWLLLIVLVLLAGVSLNFARLHLGVNTDTTQMLDAELPFRQAYDRYRDEFPDQVKTLLLVVEAPTPEQAYLGAEAVRAALLKQAERFPSIDWPQGDSFFLQNGLLFRSLEQIQSLSDRLSAAQPLLARLSADPSLAGLMNLLAEAREHSKQIDFDWTSVDYAVARTVDGVLSGQSRPLSWQTLLGGSQIAGAADAKRLYRELLVVRPHLDFSRVRAGRMAVAAARDIRRNLGLDSGPVRMRITGSVALADDELSSVLEGARLAGLLSLLLVGIVMYLGLRSIRLVLIALFSLAVGLAITAGFAAVAVGRINLISVAFTVLYVGLGVNYAIHYLLRFREHLTQGYSHQKAVVETGQRLIGALSLSALTTAIGFAAFIPTRFTGVAELGLIAAFSMLVTLLMSYTLLPALLAIVPPPRVKSTDTRVGLPAAIVDFPLRHRSLVLVGTVLLASVSLWWSSAIRFDSDPLNLRAPEAESVATLRQLLAAKATGHRNLQVLSGSAEQAKQLSSVLRKSPEVARVHSLLDFVPDDQEQKIQLIDDLNWLLGFDLLAADYQPQKRPADMQLLAINRLLAVLAQNNDDDSRRLQQSLQQLKQAHARQPRADPLNVAGNDLLRLLPQTMQRLYHLTQVTEPITMASLPEGLKRRWLSAEQTYLLQVFPASDASDVSLLGEFVRQVRDIAPHVTGMPVIQIESGAAVSEAFRQALLWAIIGIVVLLVILLRVPVMVAKVLAPLALGGVFTTAAMVILDLPFNFANVVALPLLLGVGVDNGIHLVYRFRAGHLPRDNVLRTATARGIVFGALTTVLSFGNLSFSPHTGTASMGIVLAIGLTVIVLTTLFVLPALLNTDE